MNLPPDFRDLLEEFVREGVEHVEVVKNAVTVTSEGLTLRVIALEDLLANKRAAGRPQDRGDVVKLEKLRAARAQKR